MAEIPILLLAAGVSTRMGQPKQLLIWGEQTLIEHQIQTLLKTGESLIVVLGALSNEILPIVKKYPVTIVVNGAWENGMASSITCGLNEMEHQYPNSDAALITLVDQPLIPLEHFKKMMNAFNEGHQQIIASTSDKGWLGVPALFDKYYFTELRNLQGEKGAKSLLSKYPNKIKTLECYEIIEDIDTLESYRVLYQKHLKLSR